MARLYLGTREGMIAYGGGFHEIPRYELDGQTVKCRTMELKGTEFAGITKVDTGAFYGLFDSNIQISGVFSMPDLVEVDGSGLQRVIYASKVTSISFPNLKIVGQSGCYGAFGGSNITSASFPSLESVGPTGFREAFLTVKFSADDIVFQKLKTIQMNGFQGTFSSSTAVVVRFPMLDDIAYATVFLSAFLSCRTIEHVYFNALKTTSFGTLKNQFSSMMTSTGTTTTHTIHFPSNLESTIQTLTGYPLFGGTNGSVVLAFDLPATI